MALLVGGGLVAGVVNTLAGGGSLLTVPLLVMLGLPGTLANGTNRVGVLVQNLTSAWQFRAEGVSGFRDALPVLGPVLLGSVVGAYGVAQLGDRQLTVEVKARQNPPALLTSWKKSADMLVIVPTNVNQHHQRPMVVCLELDVLLDILQQQQRRIMELIEEREERLP